ncbi:MAG: hypothetical protein GF355_04725 [Candidatus Eisenbacteria bacterium]|nr:hypothetical protein [Candidatus Eisenbacteria bacterium]
MTSRYGTTREASARHARKAGAILARFHRRVVPALILLAALAAGCGQKFDLPPQPAPSRLLEPGTYNFFTVWPMEEPIDIAVTGAYAFVVHGSGEVSGYTSYVPQVSPSPTVGAFNGLVEPVQVAVAKRDSIFVFVADAGDMTIKRYYYLGGDPLHTFSDTSWVEFSGLAADRDLNVYVSEATEDRVTVYDAAGRFSHVLSSRGTGLGFVISPHGLAYNGEMVVVADTGKDWIQRLDPAETNRSLFAEPISPDIELLAPEDVAADREGRFIFIADTGHDRVLKMTTEGAFEDTVYTRHKIPEVSPALTAPRAVAAEDVYVYLADPEQDRVVVLQFVSS